MWPQTSGLRGPRGRRSDPGPLGGGEPGIGGSSPASQDPSPYSPPLHSSLRASFLFLYQPTSFVPQAFAQTIPSHCRATVGLKCSSFKVIFTNSSQTGHYNTYHNHDGVTVSITRYVRPVSLPNQSSKKPRVLSEFFFTIIPSI